MNWWTRLRSSLRGPAAAISADDWAAIETSLPFLARLDEPERQRLRALACAFLEQKEFSGAQGLVVDNRMRLSIALQACLPILELGIEAYEDWIGIVVYPGEFAIPRRKVDDAGVLHEYVEPALGEAWENGPVVLAWYDDARHYEGANVVIHEFAHKLDMLNGPADGCPPLHAGMSEAEWDDAFDEAYNDFCDAVEAGEQSRIDPYAATHPAEFFAVMSEVFFVAPDLLRAEYPRIYGQLSAFYRQDPAGR